LSSYLSAAKSRVQRVPPDIQEFVLLVAPTYPVTAAGVRRSPGGIWAHRAAPLDRAVTWRRGP